MSQTIFKKPTDSLNEIFKNINTIPKNPCRECGKIYRNYEPNFRCNSCKERELKKREELEKKNQNIKKLLHLSNIPKRYKTSIFKPINPIQTEVSNYFLKNFSSLNLKNSTDILLFGAIGTGKTYLSCAFAIECIEKSQIEVKFITEYQLLNLYFQKQYIKFERYRDAKILIVDEIGKRDLAEWQKIQLEELLSHRFNEMLPTIYITNLRDSEFRDFLGKRLADRLRENSLKRFSFSGESFRGI